MSRIEQIVKDRLKDEFNKQLISVQSNYSRSMDELNATYDNLLETLHQLELTDATLFDFFEKCDGNIRIKTLDKTNWNEQIDITISGLNPFGNNNINLKKDKVYKIILMAIEEDDNKEE